MNGHDLGSLIVITGPMFSGKSDELLRSLKRYTFGHTEFVLFKPVRDNRYSDNEVVTHDGLRLPATVVPTDPSCRDIILNASRGISVAGFDEVQFWEKAVNLPELLSDLAAHDKIVYATLLNMDFTGKPFGSAGNLLSYANQIVSLTAVCQKCGSNNAIYSQRIDEKGKALLEGETIQVGGKRGIQP